MLEAIPARTDAQTGDILFFGADSFKIVTDAMGALRLKLGRDLALTQLDSWAPLWVVDFPMFEEDEEGGGGHAPPVHLAARHEPGRAGGSAGQRHRQRL